MKQADNKPQTKESAAESKRRLVISLLVSHRVQTQTPLLLMSAFYAELPIYAFRVDTRCGGWCLFKVLLRIWFRLKVYLDLERVAEDSALVFNNR